MKNSNEYTKRQLSLMHENLIFFEKNRIKLSSLVGNLEFLLNALESIDEEWEDAFLKEISVLETVSALEIIHESGEKVPEIENQKKESLIKKSIANLKKLIEEKLCS